MKTISKVAIYTVHSNKSDEDLEGLINEKLDDHKGRDIVGVHCAAKNTSELIVTILYREEA